MFADSENISADGPKGRLHGKAIPPFSALRAFEAVGREGGIRKAALVLDLDHAVVSRHIRALEEWLGEPLFQRAAGRLVFTDVGAIYHARVSFALIELAAATADIVERPDLRQLRLSCVPGFAFHWLSDQIAEYLHRFPGLEIELRPTDTAPNLLMLEADADIRFYAENWPPSPGGKGLRYAEIARPLSFPVANPDVAERLNRVANVADLAAEQLLHQENHHEWRAWFTMNGVEVPERLPGSMLWHAHLALAAAQQGRGIAMANRYLAHKYIADGSLREIKPVGARSVNFGAYIFVARADHWFAPPLAQFRRFLQQRAADSI